MDKLDLRNRQNLEEWAEENANNGDRLILATENGTIEYEYKDSTLYVKE